jgi:hypothetical protein
VIQWNKSKHLRLVQFEWENKSRLRDVRLASKFPQVGDPVLVTVDGAEVEARISDGDCGDSGLCKTRICSAVHGSGWWCRRLFGLAVGSCAMPAKRFDARGRALVGLLDLYLAVALFAVAVGIWHVALGSGQLPVSMRPDVCRRSQGPSPRRSRGLP